MDVHHLEGYIKMAWSASLEGPWNYSRHTMVTPGSVNDWDAMVTNPSPLFLADGTAYIFYRGTQWPVNGYERIGFAKATSWKGPYGRPFGNHDPLWDAEVRCGPRKFMPPTSVLALLAMENVLKSEHHVRVMNPILS